MDHDAIPPAGWQHQPSGCFDGSQEMTWGEATALWAEQAAAMCSDDWQREAAQAGYAGAEAGAYRMLAWASDPAVVYQWHHATPAVQALAVTLGALSAIHFVGIEPGPGELTLAQVMPAAANAAAWFTTPTPTSLMQELVADWHGHPNAWLTIGPGNTKIPDPLATLTGADWPADKQTMRARICDAALGELATMAGYPPDQAIGLWALRCGPEAEEFAAAPSEVQDTAVGFYSAEYIQALDTGQPLAVDPAFAISAGRSHADAVYLRGLPDGFEARFADPAPPDPPNGGVDSYVRLVEAIDRGYDMSVHSPAEVAAALRDGQQVPEGIETQIAMSLARNAAYTHLQTARGELDTSVRLAAADVTGWWVGAIICGDDTIQPPDVAQYIQISDRARVLEAAAEAMDGLGTSLLRHLDPTLPLGTGRPDAVETSVRVLDSFHVNPDVLAATAAPNFPAAAMEVGLGPELC